MKFLASLSESRLLSSNTAYRRFHARTVCELAVLHVCALRILANDVRTHDWARNYALRSAKILKFARFYSSTTDLSLLMYATLNPEQIEFRDDSDSQYHMEGVNPDEQTITSWLNDIARGRHNEQRVRRMFLHLDHDFCIENMAIRSIRRLVLDWPNLTNHEHKLAMTRLLQIIRTKALRSDIYDKLQEYADEVNLEIKDADHHPHDAPHDSHHHDEPKKKSGGLLKTLATAGAAALGYVSARKFLETDLELEEEASAGATCVANIATNAVAFGGVQRRQPPTK